jgi:hypothetical protein
MTSQAETVELLVKKANFQPHVALAVAEAIDHSIRDSQFVTVPILDARLGELKAELKAMIEVSSERLSKEIVATKAELARWVLLAMLGSFAIATAAAEVSHAIHPH